MKDTRHEQISCRVLGRLGSIRQNRPLSYGVAVGCFLLGLGMRVGLTVYFPSYRFPFLTFFPAVVLSAFVGGLGPGLLTAGLSAAAAWLYLSPEAGERTNADLVGFAFFVLVLLLDCILIHAMNTAMERAQRERETSAELARQLEQRLSDLRAANEQTEAASRAKSRMMASVGHDLRQPLNVISMAVQMLGRGVECPRERDLIERTRRNVSSLARSFDLLLEAARLESDSFRPNVGEVELQPLLSQLHDEFSALAADKGLRFVVPSVHDRVLSDAAMLLSILRNFLGNAVKYTPSGGSIQVGVKACSEGLACIEIVDSGAGIPAGKMDLIFREFERLDQADGDGIGLGLSLVKKNAELLGHRLLVESSPGHGSRFGVEVPLVSPAR